MVAITKRDPWASLFSFPRWMEEFEDSGTQRGLKIYEDEKNIYIEAVVAGIPAEKVDVDIEDGVVTIKAEIKEEEKEKGEFRASARRYYYTAALSGGQWNKANADVEHGVVIVTIPKAEEAKPHKIKVKAKGK